MNHLFEHLKKNIGYPVPARRGVLVSPDILVAVDVDSVKLMLEVFVLYICHVVDHFQNYEARQH